MSKICYFPNGDVSPDHAPCNSNAEQSSCCHIQDACLSNGYCFAATDWVPNEIYRGSCTDKSFQDDACPFYCNDVNQKRAIKLAPVRQDGNQLFFCCRFPENQTYCSMATHNSHAPFVLKNADMITNRANGEASWPNKTTIGPGDSPDLGAGNSTAGPSTSPTSSSGGTLVTPTNCSTGGSLASPSSTSRSVQNAAIGFSASLLTLLFLVCLLSFSLVRQANRRTKLLEEENRKLQSRYDEKHQKLRSSDTRASTVEQLDGTPLAELGENSYR